MSVYNISMHIFKIYIYFHNRKYEVNQKKTLKFLVKMGE